MTTTQTPPHQSQSRSQPVGTIVRSPSLIMTPGLWFNLDSRNFLVDEGNSSHPFPDLVSSFTGTWELIDADIGEVSSTQDESRVLNRCKRHVDTLDLSKFDRERTVFNVWMPRPTSLGTWFDANNPSRLVPISDASQISTSSSPSRSSFRRLSAETIPTDESKRDLFLQGLAEVAERSGIPTDFLTTLDS